MRTTRKPTLTIRRMTISRPAIASSLGSVCAAVLSLVLLGSLVFASNSPKSEGNKSEAKRAELQPYALIFGTVWDPDRVPIYGIKVHIRRADEKKPRWELVSNHTGEFAQRVPAGKADYIVWADVKGVKLPSGKHLKPSPEVTVHIENDERADTGIHLNW